MTRIRYFKHKNHLCFANILVKKGFVCGYIDPANLFFIIQSQELGTLVKGQGKTLAQTKKLVKENLKLLGANFNSEIRTRGKTKKL
jgi:hypothetical protein